jgi:hypothetical protein
MPVNVENRSREETHDMGDVHQKFLYVVYMFSDQYAETIVHAPHPWLSRRGTCGSCSEGRQYSQYSNEDTADDTIYIKV